MVKESATKLQQQVDLNDCDREPIHIPGAIQAFGFLIALSADWFVRRVSRNVEAFIGHAWSDLLGRPLTEVLAKEAVHDIRGRLQMAMAAGVVERLYGAKIDASDRLYDLAVHVADDEIILEFEPTAEGRVGAASAMVRSMLARIERETTEKGLCKEAARQVRGLTGFDRVMVYRFDETGSGEVVAESLRGGMQPYLGLHYPASDIPKQARALYLRNFLRIIADVRSPPIAIEPALSPEGTPLDMSMSMLRSVSPIHLEYLGNMGVGASMSISIVQRGKLWGLIACHHNTPLRVDYEKRSAAELFGHMFSFLLENRLRAEDAAFEERARTTHNHIAGAFASQPGSIAGIPDFLLGLNDYIAADGVGTYHHGEITLTGATPTREEFLGIVRFLNKTAASRIFATHHLASVYPKAEDYVMRAAGLLSIPISRSPRDYLVFFRREALHAVTWAGEPAKAVNVGPNGMRLQPRKSFEAWRDVVEQQSNRWSHSEIRAAEALRVTLLELVIRMSDAADAERNAAAQRQEILIAELNHRVRNILGLVRGIVGQSAAGTGDVKALTEVLEGRIQSLAVAHDLLTSASWEPCSLAGLIEAEVGAYCNNDAAERVVIEGPEILLAPSAFSTMALVIHELTTNARKYGALRVPHGRVLIQVAFDKASNVEFQWREVDGPPVTAPKRRGFGSTIIEQAVPFDLKGESRPQFDPLGFRLDLLLPAAMCVRGKMLATKSEAAEPKATSSKPVQLTGDVLVVEDNLFIAIDTEELLSKLGAVTVFVAKSVAEALALVEKRDFVFALLDVNLGNETSLPVARALGKSKVPFAFGTGYGTSLKLPPDLAEAVIVPKPYSRATIVTIIDRLLQA